MSILLEMNANLTKLAFIANFVLIFHKKYLLKSSDLYIKIESYLWQIWDNHTKAVNLLKWIKDLKLGGPFILDFARLRLAACCQGPPHLHIKNTGSQRSTSQSVRLSSYKPDRNLSRFLIRVVRYFGSSESKAFWIPTVEIKVSI